MSSDLKRILNNERQILCFTYMFISTYTLITTVLVSSIILEYILLYMQISIIILQHSRSDMKKFRVPGSFSTCKAWGIHIRCFMCWLKHLTNIWLSMLTDVLNGNVMECPVGDDRERLTIETNDRLSWCTNFFNWTVNK